MTKFLKDLVAFLFGFFAFVFFIWIGGCDIFPIHRSPDFAFGFVVALFIGFMAVCIRNLIEL